MIVCSIGALSPGSFHRGAGRSWAIGAGALAVYAALASSRIVDGDNAEFATLGALGGRAHPSGYPLYVMWLRAWSWLPGTTPAHTAALATAVLGALAVGVLHAACRAWGARPLAAMVAAAMFGASPLVLRYHGQAEVFALNDLVCALVLWLAAERGPLSGGRRAMALGLVAGLGLANNLTCVLVAPIGLLGVVRAARESRFTAYAHVLGGCAIGLLPYAYLYVADGPVSWGQVDSVPGLVAFFLRREYGGAASFMPGAAVPWSVNVLACLETIARSWRWLPAVAGCAMLGVRISRPAGESRWAWALLAASFVLAGPVLASRFNVDPHGLGAYVCQRFQILPQLVLAIPVAAALDVAAGWLPRPRLAVAAAALGVAVVGASALPRLQRIHSPAMELGVQNLLRSLPRDAIVVVTADDQCFGGRYLQWVRGERPDVALVCGGLLPTRWYRAAWASRGLEMPPSTRARLGDALLRTGRPVFVDPELTELLSGFASYPHGVVRRVLPHGAAPPAASEVAAINRDLYGAFDLDYARPGLDDEYAAIAHHRYASSWAAIARLLDAAGDRPAALDAFELTRTLQPTTD